MMKVGRGDSGLVPPWNRGKGSVAGDSEKDSPFRTLGR